MTVPLARPAQVDRLGTVKRVKRQKDRRVFLAQGYDGRDLWLIQGRVSPNQRLVTGQRLAADYHEVKVCPRCLRHHAVALPIPKRCRV